MSDYSTKPMYTVFEIRIIGEIEPGRSAAYSRAASQTIEQRSEGNVEVWLFLSAHPDELRQLLDTEPNVLSYKEIGTADAYGRIKRW